VLGELLSQLLLGQWAVFYFGPVRRRLGEGSSSEPKFDFLARLVSGAGIPSIPRISTSYPSRQAGSAFSMRGRLKKVGISDAMA